MITTQQRAAFKIVMDALSKSDNFMAQDIRDCIGIFLVKEKALAGTEEVDDSATNEEILAYANYLLSRPIGAVGLILFHDWIENRRSING